MPDEPTCPKRGRSTTLTSAQRSLRARSAAFAKVAQGKTDTTAATAAAKSRFDRLVDPDGLLSTAERAKRAEAARKKYMTDLQLLSSKARSKRTAS